MSTGKQGLIGAAGAGLLVVNLATGKDRDTLDKGFLSGAKGTAADRRQAHDLLKRSAGALIAVALATIAAGVSDAWASAILTIIAALWVLWAINHYAPGD